MWNEIFQRKVWPFKYGVILLVETTWIDTVQVFFAVKYLKNYFQLIANLQDIFQAKTKQKPFFLKKNKTAFRNVCFFSPWESVTNVFIFMFSHTEM